MRRGSALFGALVVWAALCLPLPGRAGPPPQTETPPGQVVVVTVNAHQSKILGIRRFRALYELSVALRRRPPAFNGGSAKAVAAPDVIVVQEIRPSNVEVFERLVEQRFGHEYQIVSPVEGVKGIIIADTQTVTPGVVSTWDDVCLNPTIPDAQPKHYRKYAVARFSEIATGTPFVVAGMHMSKHYPDSQSNCYERNIQVLQTQVEAEPAPVIIGGDFNRRAVETIYECDPEETSPPLRWWSSFTSPSDGTRAYVDAVQWWHRDRGRSLADEWTHEWRNETTGCDQATRLRRTRIDYLFASGAIVAEAHADHPGWSGGEPGTCHPSHYKYSDHRFVQGRFVISGPPQPAIPSVVPDVGGLVHVSWTAVEGVTQWVVYRALGRKAYDAIATLPAETLAYDDNTPVHGLTYRYAIAPVGANGAQGLESVPNWITIDARGPRVEVLRPGRDATSVDPRVTLRVVFNEDVDPASVTSDSLRLFRDGNDTRVGGYVTQVRNKVLEFDPAFALKKGVRYHAVVSGVRDAIGNRGPRVDWRFTTVPPPPPPPKKKG